MALFKINRGNASNLPATKKDGWAYFCTDTGDLYIDWDDGNGTVTRTQINSNYAKYTDHIKYKSNGSYVEVDIKSISDHIKNTTGNPHNVTASQTGAVPTSRKINGKNLSSDIVLGTNDIDGLSDALKEIQTAADVVEQGNSNPVTSGAVYEALLSKEDASHDHLGETICPSYIEIHPGYLPASPTGGYIDFHYRDSDTLNSLYEDFSTRIMETNPGSLYVSSKLEDGSVLIKGTIPGLKPVVLKLYASGFTDLSQEVPTAGVMDSNVIIVTPAPDSISTYCACGMRCTQQGSNKLVFVCDTVPEADMTVNVVILT